MTNIQAINLLKGLEQSLDDYCELNDEGKTAFRMAITALEVFGISEQLPSAQPDVPDINVGDMISRQAAIDAPFKKFDMATGVTWIPLEYIEKLPSAQPEIIRCKDCRWGREACGNIECFADINEPPEYHGYEWFCPNGKRRTDDSISD